MQTKNIRAANIDNSTQESRKRLGIEERQYNVTVADTRTHNMSSTFLSPRMSDLSRNKKGPAPLTEANV